MLDRQWAIEFERNTRYIEIAMLVVGVFVAVIALWAGIWLGRQGFTVNIDKVIVESSSSPTPDTPTAEHEPTP